MAGKTVSRRQFLKHAGATAALLGLSEAMIPSIAKALEGLTTSGKPAVIYLQGQNCTGCSISLLNSNYPSVAELVLDKLSIRYHPNISAAAGYVAMSAITETAKANKGKFVLVTEGPVPTAENGAYCTFGVDLGKKKSLENNQVPEDKSYEAWLKELIPNAAAVICNGNCASYGGIPFANASVTGSTPIPAFAKKVSPNTPVVNVGGCPSHPDWFVGTVLEALLVLTGKMSMSTLKANLDSEGRSKTFFGKLIHENCERRAAFDSGIFLENWNDQNADFKQCMFKMGCKGPVTYADCPTRRWNSAVNWCVGANAPCHGCAEQAFYKDFSPLYKPLPNMNFTGLTPSTDVLGWVAAGATAVGVGAHYLYKQLGNKPEEPEGGEK